MAEREAELLPVPYFHVVYTLPAPIADLAYQNKRVIYGLLLKAAAEATLTIAADNKHLGARSAITAVLHTWGSAMTHHLHVHMIVPGGGLSKDGSRWISCRPDFFLPVRVLSRLFRRLMLTALAEAHAAGELTFFGPHAALADKTTFSAFLAPLRKTEFVVYAKEPFAGPEPVLRYLSQYTHRVAISNRRLLSAGDGGVAFRWNDDKAEGADRWKTMILHPHEFIRRFLMHVLPKVFIASGITASSPTATGRPTSLAPVSCSAWPCLSRRPNQRQLSPTTRVCILVLARAVAAACSSSRSSRAAASRNIGLHPVRP